MRLAAICKLALADDAFGAGLPSSGTPSESWLNKLMRRRFYR
jgi:hypothetical protein